MLLRYCFEVEVNSRFDIVSSMFNRLSIDIDFIKVDQYHCDRCFFDIVSILLLLVASTSLTTGLFQDLNDVDVSMLS